MSGSQAPAADWIAQRTRRLIGSADLPVIPYVLEEKYPHDPAAFTQGLYYDSGCLLESTGTWGQSSVRRVRIEDGHVTTLTALPAQCFGEGLVRWGNEIIVLTWQNETGFRFDSKTLLENSRFSYRGEAWGLTCDEVGIILSDGSSTLRFLDPTTFAATRTLNVTASGYPVRHLNDLVWVAGEVWANVWYTDLVARIDGETGKVLAWLDLSGLRRLARVDGYDKVLNGIAYSELGRCFFVTGKLWPQLYKIQPQI